VQPDEQLGLTARQRTDGMRIPDVLEESSHEGLINHSAGRSDARSVRLQADRIRKNPNADAD
jgi:hypothetical protein